MLGKIEGDKKGGRPHVRWTGAIKEVTDTSLQELSKAVEDRTAWASLIYSVGRSQF